MSEIDETRSDGFGEGMDDALELSVAAAMARQYNADSRSFLIELARLLDSALPGAARVRRAGLLGGDNRPVRRIEVDFRDPAEPQNSARYVIEDTGGSLMTSRTQVVRGITLKTESLPVPEWLHGVGKAIARHAAQSKATRDALAQLL